MLILLFVLLMLSLGRCTDVLTTVDVGEDVTLTCTRQNTVLKSSLHWIRLVSGNVPEILGGTLTFDYEGVHKTHHTTAEQGPGTFLLHIHGTQLNDTGLYFCVKVTGPDMTLLKGTFLRVKGPKPDITAVIQPPSDPGDSETLQCSVLSQNEACPGESSVYWFRAGSDESQPSLVYIHGNRGDECETRPKAQSTQECLYSLSETDAGTYYCAVATCGEILFGNGTKLDSQAPINKQVMQQVTLFLVCAALATSVIVNVYLIYTRNRSGCCNAAIALETNAATGASSQQSQQMNEESLTYSAPTFTKRKAGKSERRTRKAAEGETVYSDIMHHF